MRFSCRSPPASQPDFSGFPPDPQRKSGQRFPKEKKWNSSRMPLSWLSSSCLPATLTTGRPTTPPVRPERKPGGKTEGQHAQQKDCHWHKGSDFNVNPVNGHGFLAMAALDQQNQQCRNYSKNADGSQTQSALKPVKVQKLHVCFRGHDQGGRIGHHGHGCHHIG